jgi:hypothetical protein
MSSASRRRFQASCGAHPDDEAPWVGVLDDLDDGLVEVHAYVGGRADHGHTIGRQGAEAPLESTAVPVGAGTWSARRPSSA